MANEFSLVLADKLHSVENALPVGFNTDRFVQNAVAFLNNNKTLQKYAKDYGTAQIISGMTKAAFLGLDALNNECYLIPYKDELQFMTDYRGNVKLCKKYSIRPIKDIYAKLVREGDDFSEDVVIGEPSINFKPIPFNNGNIIGAFAVCLFADGGMIYDTMSLADMENSRKSSKAPNSPAWTRFPGEMYKKTVLHRLCKHIELEFDSPDQRKYFGEEMELASTEEQVENEIEAQANTVPFDVEGEFVD